MQTGVIILVKLSGVVARRLGTDWICILLGKQCSESFCMLRLGFAFPTEFLSPVFMTLGTQFFQESHDFPRRRVYHGFPKGTPIRQRLLLARQKRIDCGIVRLASVNVLRLCSTSFETLSLNSLQRMGWNAVNLGAWIRFTSRAELQKNPKSILAVLPA